MNKLFILLPAATLCAAPALAQEAHPASAPTTVEVINGNGDDVTNDIYEVFVENAPKDYRHSIAPRFAIVGKDNKFYLGIGGSVKGTVSYDWGNPIDNPNDFTTYNIPMSVLPGNGGLLQFSGQQSDLFVNMVALPGTANKVGAYIKIDFTGNNYAPNLSKAYLTYRGLTAGYAYSLFSDMAACPPTIDDEGPNALTCVTQGVLNYELSFAKGWKFGAGVEMPITSLTTNHFTRFVNQRVPDIPAYIQYSWARGNGRVRLSAILRNMQYRDNQDNKNRNAAGWGVKLSGNLPIAGGLSAYYQAAYGQGIASYFQDLTGANLDLMPYEGKNGELKQTTTWGAYGGLQYNFTPNLFMTATYSHLRNYMPDAANGHAASYAGDNYRYAQYVVGNLFWNVNSFVQCGVEYLYGRRVNIDGSQAHDNRLQAMVSVSF